MVDTSSWIEIEDHPAQNRILDLLPRLIEAGRIKAPPEVREEIVKVGRVKGWLQQYSDQIFGAPNEVEYLVWAGRITHAFAAMQGARGTKEKADAWVIALAAHKRGNPQDWRVVANETDSKRPNRKIPSACAKFGVPCLTIMEMLKREFPEEDW